MERIRKKMGGGVLGLTLFFITIPQSGDTFVDSVYSIDVAFSKLRKGARITVQTIIYIFFSALKFIYRFENFDTSLVFLN